MLLTQALLLLALMSARKAGLKKAAASNMNAAATQWRRSLLGRPVREATIARKGLAEGALLLSAPVDREESLPRIFDNIETGLLPALRQTLDISTRGDFCVVWRVNLDERAATIKMALQRSRRDDDCRAATITQAVFSSSSI